MKNLAMFLSLTFVACSGGSGSIDGGSAGGAAGGGGSGAAGGSAGGSAAGGAGGGGGSSGFAGDACGNQRTLALTQMGTDYVGTAISDTSLATADVTPTCGPKTKDVVFKVVAPVAGSLHVTVTPHGTGGSVHFDPVISVFTGASCAAAASAACGDTGAVDAAETLIQQVPAGTVWVWISGADPADTGSEFDVNVLLD